MFLKFSPWIKRAILLFGIHSFCFSFEIVFQTTYHLPSWPITCTDQILGFRKIKSTGYPQMTCTPKQNKTWEKVWQLTILKLFSNWKCFHTVTCTFHVKNQYSIPAVTSLFFRTSFQWLGLLLLLLMFNTRYSIS